MADRNSASMESGSTSAEEGAGSCVVHPTANNNDDSNNNANACETSMWEEWTQATNSNGDEVSTSNLQLPELCNTSSSRSLTSSFHHHHQQAGDMMQLSSWLSGFQPLNISCSSNTLSLDLTHNPDPAIDNPPTFMQLEAGLVINPDHHSHEQPSGTGVNSLYPNNQSSEVKAEPTAHDNNNNIVYGKSAVHPYQMQTLGPESPSSPLAFHNGSVHPFSDHWDSSSGAAVRPTLMPWRSGAATAQGYAGGATAFGIPDHSPTAINHLEGFNATRLYGHHHHHTPGMSGSPGVMRPRHTDIFVGPDGNFEAAPAGWAPPHQLYSYKGDHHHLSGGVSVVRPLKLMASLREAHGGGVTPMCTDQSNHRSFGQDHIDFLKEERKGTESSNVEQSWPGKHRLELMEADCEDDKITSPPLKRPNLAVDDATAALWTSHRMGKLEYTPSSLTASQALDMMAIGPALNTNGKPRARRGSATDPQSVYARHRRERINERLKTLQHLVPNGAKVDIVTMLEEAISYVKFLQLQVKLLRSDEYWMYATPNTYNGVDISNPPLQTQGLESSA